CPASDNEAICTYSDHRMAMAFAPAAVSFPGLIIEDVEVVSKSYPEFWSNLADAGFKLEVVK
ncbi:MAG: 3-phosphoshikimate 1-carboxyvinyltransferase, partial [Muribaculaceae bacterium]|nr:3-phosphoshikimate 1-carboxyvinyltransferase [Muribaculaceae bacterium]